MKKFVFAFATFLFFTNSFSQTNNLVSARVKTKIDSTYNALIKKYKVVGASLAIVDSGRIVYSMGYGFADRENKIAATDKTIFRIGSCTKSFTSLSILQLQEKGLVNVNASVKKYLPELAITSRFNDNNEIYVNDMMCHLSGLPCDIMNGFFCDTPPDINWVIQELNKQTTMSPRRYKHAYSNIAFGLLGEVIARKSNMSYSEYIKKNIFIPLGMSSSYIDIDKELEKNYSKAYCFNKPVHEPFIRDQAAGLIHSTSADMGRYLLMFLNKGEYNGNRIISEVSLKDMESNHVGDAFLPEPESWGYGLYSGKVKIKKGADSSLVTMTGHGGDTYSFHSDFAYIPELGVGVVVLTNTDNGTRVCNATKLLNLYLNSTRGYKCSFNQHDSTLDKLNNTKDIACSENEIAGTYNFGQFYMKTKSARKMKFWQGPAKVVLKQKKSDHTRYAVKALVFGLIPIKIRDQEMSFVKRGDNIYMKVDHVKSKTSEYIVAKSKAPAISASWKKRFGSYKAVSKLYPCKDCPYANPEGMTMKLMEKDGFVTIALKAKTSDFSGDTFLDVVDEKVAVSGGIGRGTGETVRILDNGHIYYSGFEFEKIK